MNRRKTVLCLIAAAVLLLPSAHALDTRKIQDAHVVLDGRLLADRVYLFGGTLYAPIRPLADRTGGRLAWDPTLKTAYLYNAGGVHPFSGGNGSLLIGERLYTPIRLFAEAQDLSVFWDAQTKTAILEKKKPYSEEDVYWLARIICAEACAEPMEGKIAVGNVVLNRVASAEFPDTIYDVIFDRSYGVQFEPVLNGTVWNEPDKACIEAAVRALEGENIVGDSLYFFNPELAESTWIAENRSFRTSIGSHDFYF